MRATYPRHGVTMRQVQIDGDVIRLGQFLKLGGLAESGADARTLITAGYVTVNGATEDRRGRQLHRGDVVVVSGEATQVT